METNFYRKVKQGAKLKGTKGGDDKDEDDKQDEGKSLLGGLNLKGGDTGLGKMNFMMDTSGSYFKIDLPPGAKVVAIGGTADDYVRSLFAYYRI